jgi:aspartate/methionine/tyrosine aminotransferase
VFEPIAYREWMRGRPEAALHDLGTVALRGDRDSERRAVPPPLVDRPDPPTGATLHTQLATLYGVHPEQVLVTAGATHANGLAAATALADGDRILVEKPGPGALAATPAALGATVDRFARPAGRLEPDRVANAVGEETALVGVTNRHEPTGHLADRGSLAAVAEAADEAGARLLVDESRAAFLSAPSGNGPFGGVTAAGLDGAVVTGSLSAFPGLPELRIGWLLADREFVAAARQVRDHCPAVAETSVALAERALYAADDLATEARDLLTENATLLEEFVAGRPDVTGGSGTNYAFLDCGADGERVAQAAWEAGVLVVPGRCFGAPDRVRVALGRAPADGEVALRQFGAVLDGLR